MSASPSSMRSCSSPFLTGISAARPMPPRTGRATSWGQLRLRMERQERQHRSFSRRRMDVSSAGRGVDGLDCRRGRPRRVDRKRVGFGALSHGGHYLARHQRNGLTTNRLSLNSAASLFNHDGAGHQLKINKAASAHVSSLLFQTDFAGRAELGLSGDDDFRIKVSTDGTAWKEVLGVDRASGSVRMPFTAAASAPNVSSMATSPSISAASGRALAANAFGFDRWKADASGANLSVSSQVVTLASGTILQVIEPGLWGAASFASTQFTISVEAPSADLSVSLGSVAGTSPLDLDAAPSRSRQRAATPGRLPSR